MPKTKLEKVLEYMVNGENELASEMLHEHLIETARDIYAELAEEDDHVEDDLDLDESFHDDDESGDFEDDLESMEDEIETEAYFGEDEEEDESFDDLDSEMDDDMGDDDFDMEDDFGDDDMGGDFDDADTEDDSVENAMVNVEDAMDELRAAFADLMGGDEDDSMDDEVADEFDTMDVGDDEDDDYDFEDNDVKEDAKLHKHNVTMKGDDDGKASPLKQNQPGIGDKGKAVNFAGGSDEKGGSKESAKKMNVTGPQEQKGKMDKKVAAPSNKSEKAKSHLGS